MQYPQRMDGLCSQAASWPSLPPSPYLAVSSADGRALQPRCLHWLHRSRFPLAVSSADGRALQPASRTARLSITRSCSILSGWTGFAAEDGEVPGSFPDELAVSSADGRALQPCRKLCMIHLEKSCSILSGWTGFAASNEVSASPAGALQYPQRMDGLCSAGCAQPFRWFQLVLQYPQRMDGLCSFGVLNQAVQSGPLAVSSADGRALQQAHKRTGRYKPRVILQYPQRMDGLCSLLIAIMSRRRARSCSILSGWTGFAAAAACWPPPCPPR